MYKRRKMYLVMEILTVEVLCGWLMVWYVHCDPSCDLAEFLHPNGTCVECPICGPGQQLSEDCGFGDGSEGICLMCKEGTFSTETSVAPCKRCTQCNLLNRMQMKPCTSTSDALCSHCLPGFYELVSMTGEAELSCVPCNKLYTIHKDCLLSKVSVIKTGQALTSTDLIKPKENKLKAETFSVVLIGLATAFSIFLVVLLLWAFLLTAERLKHVPEYCLGSEGLLSTSDLQHASLGNHKERAAKPTYTHEHAENDDPLRNLNSLSQENEVHPTSIVINVTTNIKPPNQKTDDDNHNKNDGCQSLEEMEYKLQKIWEVSQDQNIDTLDYDSIQDLSLLLDSADNRNMLRRLGRSLGIPPHVLPHLQGFQDLFQYLRTSTYTLLPQLAQAAALLPNPQVVARIHQAVLSK